MKRSLAATLLVGAFVLPAAAQTPEPAAAPPPSPTVEPFAQHDRLVYPPEFFAPYSPQTAADMVGRVPGFSINNGDGRRGFGGAGGNVLIDGARPSAKSQGLRDILSQIPAKQVARIELIRAASEAQAAGQSTLVNVVRTPGAGAGVWEIELEGSRSGRITPRGSASYSGRLGQTEFTLGLERYMEERPQEVNRTITDGAGTRLGTRRDFTPRTFRQTKGNTTLSTPLAGGVLRLNAQALRWNFRTQLDSFGFTPGGAPSDSFVLKINERQRERELGGDWERDFGPWGFKLIGLDTRAWYANNESTDVRNALGARTELVAQRRRNDAQESILRFSLGRALGDTQHFEFGAELARNRLNTDLQLTEDVGAGPVLIDLPAANVAVEEQRGEAFLTHSWKITPKWTVESGLTVETSTISQSGDSAAETELTYWKPSLQISRSIGEKDKARVRLYRDVGQLDFGDFASSAALADDRVAAGNPDLRPFSFWRLEGAYDHRFGEKGVLNFLVFYEDYTDVVDSVPVDGFDAPGNIGDGYVWAANVTANLPLDRILKGLQVDLSAETSRSEATDPLTGRNRSFSGFFDNHVNLTVRHDVTSRKFNYGIEFEKTSENEQFRVSERELGEQDLFVNIFAESTAIKGIKLQVVAWNLLDAPFTRERNFFTPDRRGALSRRELRERTLGRFVEFEISGTF
jgi:outer membrane receptor for ferrienterochelin and colicin